MEITTEITPELFDNQEQFGDSFFERFELRHNSSPLQLNNEVSKNYLFPTLYGNVRCSIGIFLCDYDAAKAMMPHPSMKPVSMLGGRSLVIFSNYIYRNVLGVKPYNEIAMTIPVMTGASFTPPVLPIVLNTFSKFGYYVFSMPVTSLENRIRGREIWGLPKDVNQITIETEGDTCTTTAFNEQGEQYVSLKLPTTGKAMHFDVASNLYSRLGDDLLQSQTAFKGTFNVEKNMGQLFGGGSGEPALEIVGDSLEAKRLRALKINPVPFQTRYIDNMNACFDLSNPDFKQPK